MKKFYSVMLLIVITLLAVSCAANNAQSDQVSPATSYSTSDKVELSFYTWQDESIYITEVCDAFNALHSNIQVTPHFLANSNYEVLLQEALSRPENDIDLFDTKGVSWLVELYNKNYISDITNYVHSDIQGGEIDISGYGTMFNNICYDDMYLGMPMRSTCWVLYYNRDIFDKAGLSYPGQLTWDEYRALARELTSGEGEDKVYGGYFVSWIPNLLALQHGSYLTDDDLTYSKESLEFINDVYRADDSHVSFEMIKEQDNNSNNGYKRFEEGHIAMCPQGEWMINIMQNDNADVNWDIAPLPVDEGVTNGTTTGEYQFISMVAKCDHPDEAYEFISFLCGEQGASILAQNAIIPAYSDENVMDKYINATGHESVHYFFDNKKYTEQLPISGYNETLTSFSDNAEKYLSGEISIDEAMESFENERQKIFDSTPASLS